LVPSRTAFLLFVLLFALPFASSQKPGSAASIGYDTLIGRLDSRDPVIRREACRLLGELADHRAIPPLGKMIKDLDEETRFRAVEALGGFLDRETIPALAEATRDPSRRVKQAAIEGLVTLYITIQGPGGITGVFHKAIDVFRQNSDDLVVAPGTQVDARVIDALGKAAGDPDDEAAKSAARGAGILRGNAAVPEMSAILFHAPPAVKLEILRAFQKIRDRRAIPDVARLLPSSDKNTRSSAAYTLGLLGAKDQTDALHKIFQEDRDKDVRHSAFEATSLMPESRDAAWYAGFLDDKDDRLREFSADALGRLPDSALPAETIDKLTSRHSSEKSARIRLALAFALASHGQSGMLAELMESLESTLHRQYGIAYLTELGRDASRLQQYYPYLKSERVDIRRYLCDVLGNIANPAALPYVRPLIQDQKNEVITAAIRAVQILEVYEKK
jgi:HEAT repeat protein